MQRPKIIVIQFHKSEMLVVLDYVVFPYIVGFFFKDVKVFKLFSVVRMDLQHLLDDCLTLWFLRTVKCECSHMERERGVRERGRGECHFHPKPYILSKRYKLQLYPQATNGRAGDINGPDLFIPETDHMTVTRK